MDSEPLCVSIGEADLMDNKQLAVSSICSVFGLPTIQTHFFSEWTTDDVWTMLALFADDESEDGADKEKRHAAMNY